MLPCSSRQVPFFEIPAGAKSRVAGTAKGAVSESGEYEKK